MAVGVLMYRIKYQFKYVIIARGREGLVNEW